MLSIPTFYHILLNEDSKLNIHRINARFYQNDIGILLTNHSERFKTTLRHGLSRDAPSLDEKENFIPNCLGNAYTDGTEAFPSRATRNQHATYSGRA